MVRVIYSKFSIYAKNRSKDGYGHNSQNPLGSFIQHLATSPCILDLFVEIGCLQEVIQIHLLWSFPNQPWDPTNKHVLQETSNMHRWSYQCQSDLATSVNIKTWTVSGIVTQVLETSALV